MPSLILAAALMLSPALPNGAPRPGALRTFRDWAVGCDNVASCKAVALAPQDAADAWPRLLLAIERDSDGSTQVSLSGEDVGDAAIDIDGAATPQAIGKGGLSGAPATKLIVFVFVFVAEGEAAPRPALIDAPSGMGPARDAPSQRSSTAASRAACSPAMPRGAVSAIAASASVSSGTAHVSA